MKYLVFTKRRSHEEISDLLKKRNPGIKGLSIMSIRKYCVINGIRTRKVLSKKETSKSIAQVTVYIS